MIPSEVYKEKREAELRLFNARLELARAKAAKAEVEGKIKHLDTVKDLEERFIAAQKSFNDLKQGGEAAWEDLKGGVEEAFGSLTDAFNRAADIFLDSALKIKREERKDIHE